MTKISIKDIELFKNHAFKVVEDNSLKELMESIIKSELINQVIVRYNKNKYEMIPGHRKSKAMELLGETVIDAQIKISE